MTGDDKSDSGTKCIKCGEVYVAADADGSPVHHFCEQPLDPADHHSSTRTILASSATPTPTPTPPGRRTSETSRANFGDGSSVSGISRVSLIGTKNIPPEALAFAGDLSHLAGQYILVKEIGKGGMGSVWKAWDTRLSRWVAIKFLAGTSEEVVERFNREARVSASIRHPNIAAIYDTGEARGQPFIAMEFVDGVSLDKHTAPLNELIDVMKQVAHAIDAAHKTGIVHRDIKPANIMINRSGWPFVLDFGLAKQVQQDQGLSASGLIMGTPAYMPPEQAQGRLHEIDGRSDVYSLGATLYWIVTRQPPFKESTPIETIVKVVNNDPVPPRKLMPSCPEELSIIILKAMEKDRARRYQTAGEFAEDLRRFRDDEPLIARPPSITFRFVKNIKRNKLVYAFGTTFAIAVVAFIALALTKRALPSDPAAFEKLWRDARRSIGFLDYKGAPIEPGKFDVAFAKLAQLDSTYIVHATDWFREQERAAEERLKDWRDERTRWIEHRAEEERIASWTRQLDAVMELLAKRIPSEGLAELRSRFQNIGSEAAAMAAYRGQATVGIFLMPYARLKSLTSGDVVLVKDGQVVPTKDVKFPDPDLVTPLSLVDLEIRDYEAVFEHPQLGERRMTIRADQLSHGGEYVISGQMAKPETITLK